MTRYTIAELEEMYYRTYKPGGSYRIDRYSRSTQLRDRRMYAAALAKAKGQKAARLRGIVRGIEECLEASKATAKTDRRVTARQEGGDDGYCWAVRVDGRLVMNGLTKTEADHEKRRQRERLAAVGS